MRILSILLLGLLTVASSDTLGTAENPYPEDHEGSDDADDADTHPDEKDDGDDEEDGKDDDAADPLEQYEDKGEGEHVSEDHLRKLHKKFDHDGDGKVHLKEIMDFHEKSKRKVAAREIAGIFDEIESTKDGHLSLEEHIAEMAEIHEGDEEEKKKQADAEIAKFKAADLNKDDKLDKDELVHLMHPDLHPEVMDIHLKEEMRKLDKDKDGKLNREEWKEHHVPGEHQDQDQVNADEDFDKLDTDKDGKISIDELRHWESGRFHTEDAMLKFLELGDKDSDKHLSEDEMAKLHNQLDDHDAHPHLLDWILHDEM